MEQEKAGLVVMGFSYAGLALKSEKESISLVHLLARGAACRTAVTGGAPLLFLMYFHCCKEGKIKFRCQPQFLSAPPKYCFLW